LVTKWLLSYKRDLEKNSSSVLGVKQNSKEWGVNWDHFFILHSDTIRSNRRKYSLVLISSNNVVLMFKRRIGWECDGENGVMLTTVDNSQLCGMDMWGGIFHFDACIKMMHGISS
jgi:hypothetical protein